MKKFTICSGALLLATAAIAQNYATNNMFRATAMSPDGSMVVGYHSPYDNAGLYKSGLWLPVDDDFAWETEYDESNLMLSGNFTCVNNAGMIGGSMKDPNNYVEEYDAYMGENVRLNFRAGAIWRNGKTYILTPGEFGAESLVDENDGGYVNAISADGLRAAGNVIIAWMPIHPAVWNYDPDSDSYEFSMLPLYGEAQRCIVMGMSADGNTIVGTANITDGEHNIEYPCIWSGDLSEPRVLFPDEITTTTGCNYISVSPDGHFVAFNFTGTDLCVYDTLSGDIRHIHAPEGMHQVAIGAVDNSGNFVGQSMLTDFKTYNNVYYSYSSDVLTELGHALSQLDEPQTLPADMQKLFITQVSADGNTFLAVDNSGIAHWLNTDLNSVVLVAPVTGLEAFSRTPSEVKLRWTPAGSAEDGWASAYKILRDGETIATISRSECIQDYGKLAYVDPRSDEGVYSYSITAIFGEGASIRESAPCEAVAVTINHNLSLPFFDNFEVIHFNEADWTRGFTGQSGEVMDWGSTEGVDIDNLSYMLQSFSISTLPYTTSLTSRWFDASQLGAVYMTAMFKFDAINSFDFDFSSDWMRLQLSTDGEHWTTFADYCAADYLGKTWQYADIDLTELAAGKQFKIRVFTQGEGFSNCRWLLDQVKIGNAPERAAVANVKASLNENNVADVIWNGPSSTYEASYILNSTLLCDYNLSNGNKPFIGAILLNHEELEKYHGMYMRGVTAFIYDDPSLPGDASEIEVMVWEDGKLVSSNKIDKEFNNPSSSFMPLSTPVKINKNKEYIVGVNVKTHNPSQAPIYYQADAKGCRTGFTDLYSEDGGETWNYVSADLEDEKSRWCIWSIRANITATADEAIASEFDSSLLGYNLYRSDYGGEPKRINKDMLFAGSNSFTDTGVLSSSKYYVTAYYFNGEKSAPGEGEPVGTAVAAVCNDTDFDVKVIDGVVSVEGEEIIGVTIYDMNGRILRASSGSAVTVKGLPAGIYLLQVATANGISTVKVAAGR